MSIKKHDTTNPEEVADRAEHENNMPSMYKVLLINDDYTPMDFVVEVLMRFFNANIGAANQIMLTVHNNGKSVCGIFSKDIAESKVMLVNEYAKNHQHPLFCKMEKAV